MKDHAEGKSRQRTIANFETVDGIHVKACGDGRVRI
jgi:hypothetical protein